ncbi:MAG: ketoacyl-ACP synthase III [Lentisphaerae bacterium]|nr:ketoacyl-ACP synthase III [Lentisphaerota bacterium]
MGVKVVGTGSYIPEKVLTNIDLQNMVDTSDEWIRVRTGIVERHIAPPEMSSGDMASIAAARALEMAGIAASEISAIVVATTTPDHVFPNTAALVQKSIGAENAFGFDLSAACSGMIYSLELAYSLLARKKYRYVLLCGAEKLSAITNWKDRNTCVLFGDGAGAVILGRTDDDESGQLASDLHTNGSYSDILKLPAGGSRQPASHETVEQGLHYISMQGKETFKLAVNAMTSACKNVLAEAQIDVSQVKLVIPHQANKRIIEAVAQRIDVKEEQLFVNVHKYGNTSAASVSICLDEAFREGRITKGDIVLLVAFGAGLTWGAQLIRV